MRNPKPTMYISGLMSGLNAQEVRRHFAERAHIARALGYHPYTPGSDAIDHDGENGEGISYDVGLKGLRQAIEIFNKDRFLTLKSDICWADFSPDGNRKSIGCSMELAWAANNPRTIVIISGVKQGDAMDHPFIHACADYWLPDYRAVIKQLRLIADELDVPTSAHDPFNPILVKYQ